jgi:DNA recombination-dependent growth factor C
MTVTNNIREEVTFDDTIGWDEHDLTNEEIKKRLDNEKKKDYLSFSWRNIRNSVMQDII